MLKNISKLSLFTKYYQVADLFIHCLDARLLISSKITWIKSYLKNKPCLYVGLKADLLTKDDLNVVKKLTIYPHLILINSKNFKNKALVLKAIKKLLLKSQKWNIYNIFVFGYPNIGKSTLINLLTTRKSCLTANRLHVTKKESWIKVNSYLRILDTPGILNQQIFDLKLRYKLILINCLKCKNDQKKDVVIYALNYLCKYYYQDLFSIFKIPILKIEKKLSVEYLLKIIKKQYLLNSNNIYLFLYEKIIKKHINWDLDLIKLYESN